MAEQEPQEEKREIKIELEGFHDDNWTAPKLWVFGLITLGLALIAIYGISLTASPM